MISSRPKEAIILAGGLGTRLRSVVGDRPKPMALICGRPFLEYLMDYWVEQGISRFVLSVGYLAETIRSHFGNYYHGCSIEYVEEVVPLGTGGGFRQALQETPWRQRFVVLINGDTWFEVDLARLTLDADKSCLPVTIVLKPSRSNDRYGAVRIDHHQRVIEFGIKTVGECLINGGCYLVDVKTVTDTLSDYPDKFSLEQDLLVRMAKYRKVGASIQDANFLDIGVPADYRRSANVIGIKNDRNGNC
ncbi:MAG: nucleotidyltransferase family protein [Acidiferrobacterales bacterium]